MSIINVASDAMGDGLGQNLISNHALQDIIKEHLKEWLINAWHFSVQTSFWIACIGCVILLILYATTLDKKYSQKAEVLFVIYAIIKCIDHVV